MKKLIYFICGLIILLLIYICVKLVEKTDKKNNVEKFKSCHIRDEKLLEIIQKLKKIHPKASVMNFCIDDKETYTEDKLKTYMCLKNKKGEYYPDNMLMYVAIHELAHAISNQVDTEHTTEEFHSNFKYLLKKAESLGLYDSSIPPIEEYCNIKKH